MDETMLNKRKEQKAKKPAFIRQDSNKKARLSTAWRRPKGHQSKIRLGMKGKRPAVSQGYRSPKSIRGASPEGLMPVRICNVSELSKVEEGCGALIPSSVGQKKRSEIVKRAADLGIKIINIKDEKEYLKSVSEGMKAREEKKAERKRSLAEKAKKSKEAKEKKESEAKAEAKEESADEEEKKKAEKKEKDKILTKKEA